MNAITLNPYTVSRSEIIDMIRSCHHMMTDICYDCIMKYVRHLPMDTLIDIYETITDVYYNGKVIITFGMLQSWYAGELLYDCPDRNGYPTADFSGISG